jgi:hypothetical protein
MLNRHSFIYVCTLYYCFLTYPAKGQLLDTVPQFIKNYAYIPIQCDSIENVWISLGIQSIQRERTIEDMKRALKKCKVKFSNSYNGNIYIIEAYDPTSVDLYLDVIKVLSNKRLIYCSFKYKHHRYRSIRTSPFLSLISNNDEYDPEAMLSLIKNRQSDPCNPTKLDSVIRILYTFKQADRKIIFMEKDSFSFR